MLPNWMIFDKKYRILRLLDFNDPIDIETLQKKSGIRNRKMFEDMLDVLYREGFVNQDRPLNTTLKNHGSKREYISRCWQFSIVCIGTVAAVVAAVTSIVSLVQH